MNLRLLSDANLERNLIEYVRQERQALCLVVLHIKEFDSRRLYLKNGHSSLFEYLTQQLKYSGGAAQRRIEAARLVRDIPDVAEKIQNGSMQLSNIGEFARAIRQKEAEANITISLDEKKELISAIENATVNETQQILAEKLDLNLRPAERKTIQKDESVHLQITLTKEQYEKLLQCRNLSSHTLVNSGDTGMAATIEHVCEQYLSSRSPSPEERNGGGSTSAAEVTVNKTLTPKTRRFILTKYKHCQYIDPVTKRRCRSRFLLQIDHRVPRWAGGTNAPDNLTALCASHNQEKYRRESGRK